MLLIWARGMVFARLNDLPYFTSSWWGFRWGALWRREKKKRLYFGYFTETPFLKKIQLYFSYNFSKVNIEPAVKVASEVIKGNNLFVFNKIIIDNDLFGAIRNHKEIIQDELNKIIAPKIKEELRKYSSPIIGIHIRRGDFKLGNQTTPLAFFIKGINVIRKVIGENAPVTIFSDADKQELAEILALPNTSMAEHKPDILDIILLSKSRVMILSGSSTFGYWAAFLSDALVIRPANDWQKLIKQNSSDGNYTEVGWQFDDAYSTQQLIEKIEILQ